MPRLTRAAFHSLAEAALESLPDPVRALLHNLEIDTKAEPGREAGRWKGSDTLLGLYVGLSRDQMLSPHSGSHLPARILLYQRNLERGSRSREELEERIWTTLRHEVAHHFGITDEQLKERWPEGA